MAGNHVIANGKFSTSGISGVELVTFPEMADGRNLPSAIAQVPATFARLSPVFLPSPSHLLIVAGSLTLLITRLVSHFATIASTCSISRIEIIEGTSKKQRKEIENVNKIKFMHTVHWHAGGRPWLDINAMCTPFGYAFQGC